MKCNTKISYKFTIVILAILFIILIMFYKRNNNEKFGQGDGTIIAGTSGGNTSNNQDKIETQAMSLSNSGDIKKKLIESGMSDTDIEGLHRFVQPGKSQQDVNKDIGSYLSNLLGDMFSSISSFFR